MTGYAFLREGEEGRHESSMLQNRLHGSVGALTVHAHCLVCSCSERYPGEFGNTSRCGNDERPIESGRKQARRHSGRQVKGRSEVERQRGFEKGNHYHRCCSQCETCRCESRCDGRD